METAAPSPAVEVAEEVEIEPLGLNLARGVLLHQAQNVLDKLVVTGHGSVLLQDLHNLALVALGDDGSGLHQPPAAELAAQGHQETTSA